MNEIELDEEQADACSFRVTGMSTRFDELWLLDEEAVDTLFQENFGEQLANKTDEDLADGWVITIHKRPEGGRKPLSLGDLPDLAKRLGLQPSNEEWYSAFGEDPSGRLSVAVDSLKPRQVRALAEHPNFLGLSFDGHAAIEVLFSKEPCNG